MGLGAVQPRKETPLAGNELNSKNVRHLAGSYIALGHRPIGMRGFVHMRKRFVKVVILLVAAVLLSGCPSLFRPDYCEVRFKNDSLDMTILWGIRVGEAEFVGTLRPGDETSYYESPSGTYPVELRDGIGLWAERTLDGFDLGPGNGYTIRVTGGTGSVITYRKEIDWLWGE